MSYPRRDLDPYTVATTKLSQDWSAARAVPHISARWLNELVADERIPGMDPMVKVRLLLAGLVAANQQQQQQQEAAGGATQQQQQQPAGGELREALGRLQQAAAGDADEWVKIMAAAAGQLDGRLDMDAVLQHSAVVQETMANLRQQLDAATAQREQQQQHERASVEPDISQLFPPLEDLYLTTRPSVLNTDPAKAPFRLRDSPAVQPLSTNVSYSAATPPPALLRQGLGRAHPGDAAFLRPQNKQQHALERKGSGLARTVSGPQQTKTGAAKHQAVQVLDEEEQKRMMAAQTEMLKERHPRIKDTAKLGLGLQAKHGFALSGIRHEDVPQPSPKPDKPKASEAGLLGQQQRQRQQSGRLDRAAAADAVEEGQLEDEDEEPAGAGGPFDSPFAAAGARGSSDSGGRLGGRRLRQAAAAGPAAAPGTVAAAVEEELMRDLFEDDEDEEAAAGGGMSGPAATGLSRSARALHSHREEGEETDMPAELQDELEDEQVEDEQVEGGQGDRLAALQRSGSGQGGQQQLQHQGSLHERAVLSAKRSRRVLDSDDDD